MDEPMPPRRVARQSGAPARGHARREHPTHVPRVAAHVGSERFFSSLAHAAARLSGSLERDAILRIVVAEVAETLPVDAVTVRLLDGEGHLPVLAWAGLPAREARRLPDFSADEPWFERLQRVQRPWVRHRMAPDLAYDPDLRFEASAVVPLVQERHVVGVLAAVRRVARPWAPDEVSFMEAVAGQAAIALHNAGLYDEAQRWAGQLSVVQASVNRMNRLTSVAEIGQAVVEETRRVVDYHNCRVYLIEAPDVVPIAFKGDVGTYDTIPLDVLRTRVGEGFTGWVAEHGEPLLIHDANADPRGATIPGTDNVDESMVVVPMKYDDETIGVVTLSKLGLRQFDLRDLQLMQILANAAATAIQSARALAETRQAAARMRSLLRMSSELTLTLEPMTVADTLARHLSEATSLDECTISFWDRATDRILSWGFWPPRSGDDRNEVYALGDFPETRRVLDHQVASIIDRADAEHDAAERDELALLGFEGMCMLPLVAKGESIGLIELYGHAAVHLDTAQLDLARAMANEAAMALENARLYEDARRLADRDPLTGFLNHRAFHERLGEEILRAHRARRPLGLLMIDLDGFKLVNDTLGHQVGDQVLHWAAERIGAALRASDVAARYGGDEFAVILPDAEVRDAEQAAARIVDTFARQAYQTAARGEVPIAVSIGIAAYPHDARTGTELVGIADAALYRVKRGAAGGYASASSAVDAAATPTLLRAAG
ncbi:MAG: diguanylate cyclase [Candidatus Limnocylindrales bacterium]